MLRPTSSNERSQHGRSLPSLASLPTAVNTIGEPALLLPAYRHGQLEMVRPPGKNGERRLLLGMHIEGEIQ